MHLWYSKLQFREHFEKQKHISCFISSLSMCIILESVWARLLPTHAALDSICQDLQASYVKLVELGGMNLPFAKNVMELRNSFYLKCWILESLSNL